MFTSNHTSGNPAAPANTHGVGELVAMLIVRSAGTDAHSTTQDRHHGIGDLAAAPASGVAGYGLAGATRPRSRRLGYDCVFLLWQIGLRSGPVPQIE